MGAATRAVMAALLTSAWALTALADEAEPPAEERAFEPTPPPAPPPPPVPADTTLQALRERLGQPRPGHWIEGSDAQIQQGRELATQGFTTGPDGERSRLTSPAFLCTHCHQVEREDPDLAKADPDARLDYAIEHDLSYLPGTTLWGIVDRQSWFNEDYLKKYGDLVKPANASLVEAIQLCNAECSQGRLLEDWEVEALLAYFWTLQVTVGDLDLTPEEEAELPRAMADPARAQEILDWLDTKLLPYAPAHTVDPSYDRSRGPELTGRPDRGQQIYERSCLHCHARPGPGTYGLTPGKGSIAELWGNRAATSNLGFHQAIRYGTRPYGVPLAYMPFYTQERMSDQGLADLVSYFAQVLGKEVTP